MPSRPTFINIGPGRCGTSWLYEVLKAHPDVAMADVKETEFFNTQYGRGVEWYESHFEAGASAVGEISNNYYLDPAVAERIRDYGADIRLILNVRNPRELLRSYYTFGQRRGLELPPLAEALNEPIGRIMGSGYAERANDGTLTVADQVPLLDSVLLGARLAPFFEVFPADQLYVFDYERLARDPATLLTEVYEFIGVDPEFRPEQLEQVVNASIVPRSRVLARVATRAAYVLRRIGAYRLLMALHRSRTLKRLFYADPLANTANVKASDTPLPAEAEQAILQDVGQLSGLHPQLARAVAGIAGRVPASATSAKRTAEP